MVIQGFSIYKTVLETDIVKQKIASGKRELQQGGRPRCQPKRVCACRDYFNSHKKPHVGGFSLSLGFSPFIYSVNYISFP